MEMQRREIFLAQRSKNKNVGKQHNSVIRAVRNQLRGLLREVHWIPGARVPTIDAIIHGEPHCRHFANLVSCHWQHNEARDAYAIPRLLSTDKR
jgi:hypothetical protein